MLKKDETIWLCIDFRPVNKATVKNQYLLLQINEMQDHLHGCTWFIILDQQEAYYRIRIKEGYEKYIVFRTPYRMYKFLVVLFEFINTLIN
jgi:hypothetical protein